MEVDTIKMKWYMYTTYALRTPHGNANLVFDNLTDRMPILFDLWVREGHRKVGEATALLNKAIEICRKRGYSELGLEWDRRESKQWVFNWYLRQGFEERAFSNHSALLVKDLTK